VEVDPADDHQMATVLLVAAFACWITRQQAAPSSISGTRTEISDSSEPVRRE